MKRFASLLLALIFIFSITACKKNNSDNNSSLPDNTTSGFISLDIEADESDNNATGDKNTEDKNDTSSKDSTTSDADKSDNSSNNNNPDSSGGSDSSNGNTDVNSKDGSDTVSDNNSSATSNNNSTKPSNNNSTDNGSKDNTGDRDNSDKDSSSNGGLEDGNSNNTDNSFKDDSSKDNSNGSNNESSNDDSESNSSNNANDNSSNGSNNNSDTSKGDSQNNTKPDNSDNSSGTTTTPDSSNSNNPDLESGSEYKNIECRSISEWKNAEIVLENNKTKIILSIPKDWTITSNGTITLNDSEIGSINTTLTENFTEIYEKTNVSGNISDVSFEKSIRKTTISGANSFKKVFKVINSDTKQIFITVNYSELDDFATAKIFNSVSYFGIYRSMPKIKNTSKPILILVTDFIKNSKIDEFLTEMISAGKKNYSVETMNISSISNNSTLIDKINNGEYSMIFQCGLSNVSDDTLNKIINKCINSNTGFIFFPVYSESESAINNFLNKYTDIYCINWKNEIEQLKNSGLGDGKHSNLVESDFYNASQYSTPLAGYVGAHMIYRNLFDTMPAPSTALLSDSEFKKLVDYPTDGLIPGQSKIEKYLIK